MARRRKVMLSDEHLADICARRLRNERTEDIARIYGISKATISRRTRHLVPRPQILYGTLKELIDGQGEIVDWAAIAAHFGAAPITVYVRASEWGILPNKPYAQNYRVRKDRQRTMRGEQRAAA